MARIENYGNDTLVTLDDKVIGTDAVDNSTKNFTVGDIVALASAGTSLTAGAGISITNGVISSTIVDTDTNNYISNVALNGTSLDFTGTAPAFSGSIPLGGLSNSYTLYSAATATGEGFALTDVTDPNNPVIVRTAMFEPGNGIAITQSVGPNSSLVYEISSTVSGGITGAGVVNNVPKWTGTSTLGTSLIIDDGNGVSVGIQPPAARFHVHNGTTPESILKLTHTTQAGAQDGMNIALTSVAGQIWLYEPLPLRFATNNAERFSIDGAGQGWFKYGLRISAGIVDSNTTKGTAGQILSSTGTDIAWINAPSGASTLSALTDTTITTPSSGQYLTYNGTTWVNTPAIAKPENLILRLNPVTVAIVNNPPAGAQDLYFAGIGAQVKTSSVHINPNDLALANTQEIEIANDCIVKVSLGAYIDNQGFSGQITFLMYETSTGVATIVGEAQFDLSNQATTIIPTTFFSFFDMLAGETYIFGAYSTQHAMNILGGSFIEFEVIK